MKTKYAEPKDIQYCIQVLKLARDKMQMQLSDSYSAQKMLPSINRVILELEDLSK